MRGLNYDNDLVLASFYQSNGAANTSADDTWCINGDSTNTLYLAVEIGSSALTFQADKGIGPKTKCTWQFYAPTSDAGAKGPVFNLVKSPSTLALLQVVEWYDLSEFATTTQLLTAGSVAYIAKDAAELTTSGNGTFLSPFTTPATASSAIGGGAAVTYYDALTTATFTATTSEDNAVMSEPGSIGQAIYYDRTTGVQNKTVRSVDSIWAIRAYDAYNSVKTTYTANSTAYTAAKTTYDAGTSTVIPDYPGTMPAWTGPSFSLGNYKTSGSTWADIATGLATATKTEMMLAQTVTSGVYGGAADANVKAYHNRYSYLQIGEYAALTTAVAITASTTVKGDTVAHAFGRLGQSDDLNVAATGAYNAPFRWVDVGATTTPTIQVTLLPEMNGADWADWDTTTNIFEGTVNKKTFATSADFDAPTAPAAPAKLTISTSTTGAKALAASVIAAATIASTLY